MVLPPLKAISPNIFNSRVNFSLILTQQVTKAKLYLEILFPFHLDLLNVQQQCFAMSSSVMPRQYSQK